MISTFVMVEKSLLLVKADKVAIYASPNAEVTVVAIAAEIAPPAIEPAPGIIFNKLTAIVLPIMVAPAPVIVDETKVDKKDCCNCKPNTAVMAANMPTWMGIKIKASEKGMGLAPAAAADAAAAATMPWALFFFLLDTNFLCRNKCRFMGFWNNIHCNIYQVYQS